jgi:hypothetical protein
MSFKISGTDVINNSRKGIFASMNPGVSSSNPGSPSTGDIYYNSSQNKLLVYNGSSWVPQG